MAGRIGATKSRGDDAVEAECACGATGRILPPDFGYECDVRVPLVEWHGGAIGDGWVALEPLPASTSICPGCQHRTGVCLIHLAVDAADDDLP